LAQSLLNPWLLDRRLKETFNQDTCNFFAILQLDKNSHEKLTFYRDHLLPEFKVLAVIQITILEGTK